MLRTYRLAEADKIVVCLTREKGIVRGVARGASKLKSKFGASLEPFTRIMLAYLENETRELVTIREADILRSHFNLAQNSETVAAMEYMGELVSEFTPSQEPNEKLFRMVRACIEAVSQSPENLYALTRYFEIWTLRLAGFWPDFHACNICRKQFKAYETTTAAIYLTNNALRCSDCWDGHDTPLSAGAYTLLRETKERGPLEWSSLARQIPQSSQNELARITYQLILTALERAPRGIRKT